MIRLIAAIDRKRGLAKQGFQPWFIPEDEQHFTAQTKRHGGIILVGSTTFRTFRGPLSGRQNYVLTRDTTPIKGVGLVHDLDAFLEKFQDKDLWVVGGAKVFAQVLRAARADELYITKIEADFGCDQFFPEYETHFTLTTESEPQEQNGFTFRYAAYRRRQA